MTKKKIKLSEVYPYTIRIPVYAQQLAYSYSSRMSTYATGEVVYDKDYLYQEKTIEIWGKIDGVIELLQKAKKLGCTSLSNSYYDVPYEDDTSIQPVIDGYPIPLRDKEGNLTKEGKDLEKVLEQKKETDAATKEKEKKRLIEEEAKAVELLKQRGYKVEELQS